MDGDTRIGPLAYTVDAPPGENSAERPIIIGGLLAGGLLLLLTIVGWFLLGFVADVRLVARGLPALLFAAALGTTAWIARSHLPRARRNALLAVTAISLGCTLLANLWLTGMKPALPQVKRSVDSVALPPGFRLLTEETRGDRFCRQGCPGVTRRYAAPPTDPDPVSTFILAMFADGWEPANKVPRHLATMAVNGQLNAQLQEIEPHVVEIRVQRTS